MRERRGEGGEASCLCISMCVHVCVCVCMCTCVCVTMWVLYDNSSLFIYVILSSIVAKNSLKHDIFVGPLIFSA